MHPGSGTGQCDGRHRYGQERGRMCTQRAAVTAEGRDLNAATSLNFITPWNRRTHHMPKASSHHVLPGIAASRTLLCKEHGWGQIPKSSKGAGQGDTELRVSATKGGCEIGGATALRGEMPSPAPFPRQHQLGNVLTVSSFSRLL